MSTSKLNTELAKIRGEIASIQDELAWLDQAPVPKAELKARAAATCRALAAEFDHRPRIMAAAHPGGNMGNLFRMSTDMFPVGGDRCAASAKFDVGPAIAWAMGDTLLERLHAEIDAMDYRPGLPMAERPERLAQLTATLRELETKEEAMIVAGEEAGTFIARRRDADPAVVLGYDPSGDLNEGPRIGYAHTPPRGANAEAAAAPRAAGPAPAYTHHSAPPMGPGASAPSPMNFASRIRR